MQSFNLSDNPCEWLTVDSVWSGQFRVCWLPGAFGDRADIRDVLTYKVTREVWITETPDEIPARVILEAVALI
jgi:hypothetical protein